jgi:transcriptional regulator of acetoin/glycerol metabolism
MTQVKTVYPDGYPINGTDTEKFSFYANQTASVKIDDLIKSAIALVCNGNLTEINVAEKLGITVNQLHKYIKKYEINVHFREEKINQLEFDF